MKFKYTGINRSAQKVSGVLEAPDEMEAKLKLKSMAIRPTSLAKTSESANTGKVDDRSQASKKSANPFAQKPIDLKGLVIFTRQFSSLIDSGVPVVQCLDILWQQEKRPLFKKILASCKEDIETGAGLAEALSKHPSAFSDFFVRIVEAGEISGTLDGALRRVGIQLERLDRIRKKVIGAVTYPAITLLVAVVVLLFLLVKVIPEISKLYSESSAQLPAITQNVLALSQWVQDNWLYIIGTIAGISFGIPILYRIPEFRKVWDPFILKVPGFGDLIKKANIGRFTRTLATLLSSGVPMLNAFEICLKLISNLAIKKSIEDARNSVTEGKSIVHGLSQSKLFPPMVLHMVGIGEMTGRLDELLTKVSDIFDDELDDSISLVTGMIQPAMIVSVGIIIAFLLIAMYLPIFQLAEKVTGGG